jgi:hypothetical protein
MDVFSFRRLISIPIFTAAIIYIFLTGCTPGVIPDELSLLNLRNDSLSMAMELDSLQRLLISRDLQYDTISSSYNILIADLKKADDQIRTLRSGYYARGQQIKKVNAENAAMAKSVNIISAERDSLKAALILTQQELIESEYQKELTDSISESLARTLTEIEKKRIADSVAELKKPAPDKQGFISINEIGGGFGLANTAVEYSKSIFSINTVAGYRVNRHFIVGAGSGVHLYDGGPMIPLYIDLRYSIGRQGKINPFIIADGGFLFVLKDFTSSGIFVNPAIGVSKKLSEKASMHLSSGLLLQSAPSGPSYGNFRRSFFSIKGGISFRGK